VCWHEALELPLHPRIDVVADPDVESVSQDVVVPHDFAYVRRATASLRAKANQAQFDVRSTAPSATSAWRCAPVTPVRPVMSTRSYGRSLRKDRMCVRLRVSHKRTVPSKLPLARSSPSAVSATL